MIKAIIFDCFGVVYTDNFESLYQQFGGSMEDDREWIEQVFFRISKGEELNASQTFANHLGVPIEEWEEAFAQNQGFDHELLEYVLKLKKSYKVSMLSNVGRDGLENHMDYSVLEEYFEDIVESAKIGFAKPEARAFEIAADRLGVRLDECVFTDDRQHYIEGAQSVGMSTVLYQDLDQFKRELEAILAEDKDHFEQ